MALTMPTGTVATITTGSVTRQFGTYSMEIKFNRSSSLTTTMKLQTMPKLSQDFDLQVEASDLSEIKVNLSEIEFTVFDGLGDGKSLIEEIASLSIGEAIQIKSIITPTGESARTDYFITSKANCTYDWESRTVTIKATSALRYDNNISNFSISGLTIDGVDTPQTGDDGEPWVTPKDLITQFLDCQGSSPSVFIAGSVFDVSYGDVTDGAGTYYDVDPFYVLNSSPFTVTPQENAYREAQDAVLRLSVIEGALTGVVMGDAFYVRRNFTGTSNINGVPPYITLNADDIASYSLKTNERSIRNYNTTFRIEVRFEDLDPSQSFSTRTIGALKNEVVSRFGAYDVVLNYTYTLADNPNMYIVESISGIGVTHSEIGGSSTFASNARGSYASALGIFNSEDALSNQMFNVELTFFDITSFRPWQYIEFGTDINPFINGRKLRPSSFEYDLEANKVKVEGYFIG